MTEYERLKEEIITTAAGYTDDIKALTTRLMTIIAERCWLRCNPIGLPEGCIEYGFCEGCKYRNNHGKLVEPTKKR